MIRIQITSPFRHQFRTSDYDDKTVADKMIKDCFLTAGSYYHLDLKKDREEIKFILSPNFVFKSYIHVDLESIPADLAKELELEGGFTNTFTLPRDEEYIPTLIQDNKFVHSPDDYYPTLIEAKDEQDYTVREPKPNIFDKTTSVAPEPEVEEVVDTVEEEKNQGALNTPDLEPVEEPSEEVENVETKDVSRETRKDELDGLHYMKIKEICELYDIDYTNKKEVVSQILDLEFGNPDSEISTNIDVKETEKGSPTNI